MLEQSDNTFSFLIFLFIYSLSSCQTASILDYYIVFLQNQQLLLICFWPQSSKIEEQISPVQNLRYHANSLAFQRYRYYELYNQYQMKEWIFSWFRTTSTDPLHKHSQITHFCCSDMCRNAREVCSECSESHRGHTLMQYKKFKRMFQQAKSEIKCRKKIEDTIRQFHQKIVSSLQTILEKETQRFLNDIDHHIYSKNFMAIYKNDLAGKNFYSLLPQFEISIGDDLSNLIQKTVKEKEQKFQTILKTFVIQNRTLVNDYINAGMLKIHDMPTLSKVDKIKSIIPFQCQLTCKFQASKHRFQANNLHKLNLRGPILLIAQSYKGKIFGGFTPKMFSKSEHYEQDNRCRSFLFSLDHRARLPIKQQYKKFAIKGGNNLWFGRGDLVIADECNKGNISWAQIGRAYQVPPGLTGNTDQWLAGALYFQIIQYEIYEVESPLFGGK